MKQIFAKEVKIIDAPAESVYETIADYHVGHPSILPKENLYDLQVEQGGHGAGTIIRFKSRVLGVEQTYRQRVSEPEPGRMLVEQDIEGEQNYVTTFIITPVEVGRTSQIEIRTTLNASPGFKGMVERLLVPKMLVAIYRKEIKLLEAVARQRASEHQYAG